jgi:hypothetical protein
VGDRGLAVLDCHSRREIPSRSITHAPPRTCWAEPPTRAMQTAELVGSCPMQRRLLPHRSAGGGRRAAGGGRRAAGGGRRAAGGGPNDTCVCSIISLRQGTCGVYHRRGHNGESGAAGISSGDFQATPADMPRAQRPPGGPCSAKTAHRKAGPRAAGTGL